MSFLPDDASFQERIQALFAHFRGHGVALSAKDVELLEQWAAAQVPFEVVARGIRNAAEQALFDAPAGQGRLESLRACRKSVEAELKKFLKATAGKTATVAPERALIVERHHKLQAAVKRLSKQVPTLARRPLATPATFEETERLETLVLFRLLRTLPWPERLAILRAARAQLRAQSVEARRDELRFHRSALVRHRLDVPAFW